MIRTYSHPSRFGTFRIALGDDARWHVWCDDDLGSYMGWPAGGDPSELGLSADLSEWGDLR
jgi:hypothetical protein